MGKRGMKTSIRISQVVPTPEELAQAKADLESAQDPAKAEKNAMANFTYFLKSAPSEDHLELLSDIEKRKKMLTVFMVAQRRDRDNQKTIIMI